MKKNRLEAPFNYEFASLQSIATADGITSIETLKEEQELISATGREQEVVGVNPEGLKKLKRIITEQGNEIVIGLNTKLFTPSGYISVSELKPGDLVLHKIFSAPSKGEGSKEIVHQQFIRKNDLPIYIPNKMSTDFARWLGMFFVNGLVSKTNSRVCFKSEDHKIIESFEDLTSKIFQVLLSFNDFYYFESKNVSKFLLENMGTRKRLKKIPKIIGSASNEEQLSFVEGILSCSPKTIVDDRHPVLLFSSSKIVSNFVSSVLRNNGYIIKNKEQMRSNGRSKKKNKYFLVILKGKHPNAHPFNFENPELDSMMKKDLNILVDIKGNDLKIKSYDDDYRRYRQVIVEGISPLSFANKVGLEFDSSFYYIKIKEIVDIEINSVVLKTLYTEGLVVNNFVVGGNY